jgi:DNA-binding GntR family transcriptional regulator
MLPKKTKLVHRTMAENAALELKRRIIEGEFPADFQLRQDALASELGISRIPLREAFIQLESEGLIRIDPHRGATVTSVSLAEVEELIDLRALLEVRLLPLSIPRLSNQHYQKLEKVMEEYKSDEESGRYDRWGALNAEFHLTLLSGAERPKTQGIIAGLLSQTGRYLHLNPKVSPPSPKVNIIEHEELVRLCKKGEVVDACTFLERHIRELSNDIKNIIVN